MKNKLLSAVMLCALGLFGCGDDNTTGGTSNNNNNPPPVTNQYDSPAKILAYLEGKTLAMDGTNIPSFPNGFDEDTNYGSASQCYNSVSMAVASGTFNVTSKLGTLRDAPSLGSHGTCDHATISNTLQFSTINTLIENVKGNAECFDVTFSYNGFAQEGRGKITADGKSLILELFFKDKATGIKCANGAVGSGGIKVGGADFTGDARQIYILQ